MKFSFQGVECSGVLVVLPEKVRTFEEEMDNFGFSRERSLKLKKVMGYDRHRIVDGDVCSSDLVIKGMQYLFDQELLAPDDFQALVVVTQTPDFLIPPTSSVIHGELGLPQDLFCLDINQGCAGFVVGLIEAFLLLQQSTIKRVVLVNVDVLSRKVSKRDRNSYPLVGDAASIVVLERKGDQPVSAVLKTDGARREALMIPAGGMRLASSVQTAQPREGKDGNIRADDHLVMSGSDVFSFVQAEVPPLIREVLDVSGLVESQIDYFAFHQPNRFMLEKLTQRLGIDSSKVPMDIVERFGNSSGVTIPAVLGYSLSRPLLEQRVSLCLAGFGVGLTWAALTMRMGPLHFCQTIDFNGEMV